MKFTSELYKCVVLTVIAVTLLFIAWKMQSKRTVFHGLRAAWM